MRWLDKRNAFIASYTRGKWGEKIPNQLCHLAGNLAWPGRAADRAYLQ
jgi:hypothetical protein